MEAHSGQAVLRLFYVWGNVCGLLHAARGEAVVEDFGAAKSEVLFLVGDAWKVLDRSPALAAWFAG